MNKKTWCRVCVIPLARNVMRSPTFTMCPMPTSNQHVVFVHGLASASIVFWRLARRLRQEGYPVHFHGYPSFRKSIEYHAEALATRLDRIQSDPGVEQMHLIGHSMGGIVGRHLLGYRHFQKLDKFITLASPHLGSPVAYHLSRLWPLNWCLPLTQLSDQDGSFVRQLPSLELLTVPSERIATIAAYRDRVIPEGNAWMSGISHAARSRGGHIDMLLTARTCELVLGFLQTGHLPTGSPESPVFD